MTRTLHQHWKPHRHGAVVRALLIVVLVVVALGCTQKTHAPVLPPGTWVYGDATQVQEILGALESLRGTPLARAASALRERIVDCDDIVSHIRGTDPSQMLEATRCASPGEVPQSIVDLRTQHAAGFSIEISERVHLTGRLVRAADGSVSLEASVNSPDATGLSALLVPSETPPGSPALLTDETVLHARIRPASGLNIASLVSEDSQADAMFRLRSELFLGTVLDGTWELAVYLPRTDQVTPPIALALDYSVRAAAKAAMDGFIAELETTWPIHHSPFKTGGFEGACFHDLKLLPDLVPCYVLSDRSIVVGWNPASVALALRTDATPSSPRVVETGAVSSSNPIASGDGGLIVHLNRLPEADLRLQKQIGAGNAAARLDYVWDTLRMQAQNDGETLRFQMVLDLDAAS